MTYQHFRCGLSFQAVASELAQEAQADYLARGQYIPVTRARVLGRLRQYKLQAWSYFNRPTEDE